MMIQKFDEGQRVTIIQGSYQGLTGEVLRWHEGNLYDVQFGNLHVIRYTGSQLALSPDDAKSIIDGLRADTAQLRAALEQAREALHMSHTAHKELARIAVTYDLRDVVFIERLNLPFGISDIFMRQIEADANIIDMFVERAKDDTVGAAIAAIDSALAAGGANAEEAGT